MNSAPPTLQTDADSQHLKLLSIFHYVLGGISALFALLPIFHLAFGLFLTFAPGRMGNAGPPRVIGLLMTGFALVLILGGWAFAVLVVLAGRFLSRRKHYNYCFVLACIECICMPLGTVLGVFTILVLMRPSVKELFSPKPTW